MTPDSENPRVTDTGETENFPEKNRNRPFNPENREFSGGWYSRGKCWNSATNDVKTKKSRRRVNLEGRQKNGGPFT